MFDKPTELQKYEWFKDSLIRDSILYGVHEDKNTSHQITLLIEAIDRKIFNSKTNCNISPENSSTNKLQRFWVTKFRECFFKLTKTECLQKTDGKNFRQIEFAIEKLKERDITVEEYLDWVFNEFFQDSKNDNFMPPQLGFTYSNFLLEKFFVLKQELIEKKKEQVLRNKELTDILNRYRVLIRSHSDIAIPSNKELLSKLQEIYNHFKTGTIDLKEFKEIIISLEEKNKTK